MENDTELGGESLSVEQAAAAFVKQSAAGAEEAKPEAETVEQGEQADDELQASDEDVSEDEGEDVSEGQSDEDDEAEPESDQGRFVASNGKVRMPDGSVSTISDLIAGNMKERDYRQKTMELAPRVKEVEAQSSAVKALEQQVNEQREYMSRLLESITPKPPDMALMDERSEHFDPIKYQVEKDRYERFSQHTAYLKNQINEGQTKANADLEKRRQEIANGEWAALQDKLPDLKDQAKAKAFAEDLQSTGGAYGFSLEEITNSVPYDHRFALVLRDAGKWRKLQASKPKVQAKVEGRPPVQRSGKRLTPDAQRAQRANDAITRLKQSGTVEDAAAAYLASRRG